MFFGFYVPTFKGYYLEGTADKAIGASDSSDPEEFRSLSASDIVKQSSFTDWNFSEVWGMGTDGPVLRIFSDSVTLIANYDNTLGLGGEYTTVWIPKTGGALPPCPFTNGSRRFTGWNTAGDGTGTPYADEGTVYGTVTLFAQWGDSLGTRYEYYDAGTADSKLFDNDLTENGRLISGENRFYTMHYVKPSGFVMVGGDPACGASWKLEAKAYAEDEWTVLARGDGSTFSSTGTTGIAINDPSDGEYCYYRIVVSSSMDLAEFYLTVKDADKDVRLPLVFFHSHEGKGTMDSVSAKNRSTIDLPKNEFTRDGYSFYGWNSKPDGSGIPYVDEGQFFVCEDAILYAQWWRPNSFTVRFENDDGTLLESVTVKAGQLPVYPGETPVKPESGEKTYIFAGWSPEIVTVTGNATYKATYREASEYKITFVNDDGTELQSGYVVDGKTPVYEGETPSKSPTVGYIYTFEGWKLKGTETVLTDLPAVTGEATYVAAYSETLRSYGVTVKPGAHMTMADGSGQTSQTVFYGSKMEAVVFTADDGYYFPENYAVASVKGIRVTRNSFTQITVSGSPTGDATVKLTAATKKAKEATPKAVFAATGPDTGSLSNLAAGMKYRIDSGEWQTATGDSADLTGLAPCTVTLFMPGNGTTTVDSGEQTINVTRAETPDLTAMQPEVINGTGSIPTTSAHQKSTNGTDWEDCDGAWKDLEADRTYYVRVKAAGTVLASEAQEIAISAFIPEKEQTPEAEFTATGPDTGTLSNTAAGMKYRIGSGEWQTVTGADLTDLDPCTITVIMPGNGKTTVDSDEQTITVTRAETPDLTAVQPAVINGTGSIPTTSEHQKSTNGTDWEDCDGAWEDL